MKTRVGLLAALGAVIALSSLASACGGDDDRLTIYAGRSQTLVQPLLEQFSKDTGIKISVKYGDGTELALGILEEGKNSPADVYYGQDVGALGALKAEGRLTKLPDTILSRVDAAFRSPEGLWVGISGRQRVIVYNTDKIKPAALPSSVLGYTAAEWKGRIGIVPRSDGFPEFVTALRLTRGDDFARQWLRDLKANNPVSYANNTAAIQAVANGEVDVAFLNHYYLFRFLEERGEGFKARNYYFTNGDIGGLFLVAGAAILDTSKHKEDAQRFLEYLLSPSAQKYFTENTHEYPLVAGVAADPGLQPLSQIDPPEIDLSDLTDLEGSLEMMRQTGILP
ncbi:MAG TPA: iron ABC transporter substrate-binding protein [Dehalococcoidia bacterium]|nr:iron ABC transporter substrate-binding protein [Dehalococcoidia bacterium]